MISEQAVAAVATRLGVAVAAIQAVAEVESSGVAFWTIRGEKRPPVRLEAHWFGKLTGHRFDASHPHISAPRWNPALAAATHEGAWDQLEEARALDRAAADQSASWGAFQIMGFHWQRLGYADVAAMVAAMASEDGQFDAFARFVESDPQLLSALSIWAPRAFAGIYNGPGQVEAYGARLDAAFARHGGTAP